MYKPRNLFEMKIQTRAFGMSCNVGASNDDYADRRGQTVVRGYHIA